jgi:hypothetical protein
MDPLNMMTTAARDGGLEDLDAVQLAEVAGGVFVPDGYCGTWIPGRLPWPPGPPPTVQLGAIQSGIF